MEFNSKRGDTEWSEKSDNFSLVCRAIVEMKCAASASEQLFMAPSGLWPRSSTKWYHNELSIESILVSTVKVILYTEWCVKLVRILKGGNLFCTKQTSISKQQQYHDKSHLCNGGIFNFERNDSLRRLERLISLLWRDVWLHRILQHVTEWNVSNFFSTYNL